MKSSSIIDRKGDPSTRKQINDNLAEVGSLKAEYLHWKTKLNDYEDALKFEKAKQAKANEKIITFQDELSKVEEEIDSDPLPEGAQPKARIQKRDGLKMVKTIYLYFKYYIF
jgi:septal ring factor EnvC (AmiA/AmiB activator)